MNVYSMAVKRKAKTGRKPKRNQRGKGFFGDVFNGLKNAVSSVVPFVKDNKLISKGLALAGHPVAGGVAGSLGFGRRRKPRIQRGRGPISDMVGMFGLGRKRGNMQLVGMNPAY
jgi:hypothetical protein